LGASVTERNPKKPLTSSSATIEKQMSNSKEEMVLMVGIGVLFGLYTIYNKLNHLKDNFITAGGARSPFGEYQNQKSNSNLPLIDWMEDLIQVHAATCNDRELSSKCFLFLIEQISSIIFHSRYC
jgi:hypothetical protein